MEYRFNEIEQKWQAKWKENKVYKVSNDSAKPKYYVLDMFPYPSGAGLHVGHPLGYIASDIYSRYKRLKGFNVLHPMGYDSFGLPAEQYALETGQHPAVTTERNIATFRSQLDKIGFSYDWDREVRTSDPDFYKWTQWIFLQIFDSWFNRATNKAERIASLLEIFETEGNLHHDCPGDKSIQFSAGEWKAFNEKEQQDILMDYRLTFSSYGEVNWCEALGTVLANDEVVNGVSERGGHPVEKKKMRQWYLRITEYADRLLEGLERIDFSDAMKEMQKNWIGKSQGAEMDFIIKDQQEHLKVYTTRPDTIFGVDFMVLAPEHELVNKITSAGQKKEIETYLTYVKSRSERERLAEVKQITGCFTGAYAINPFDDREIPIWIAEYVLAGYGTGAIMAVPCGDQRDFAFAKHFNIPITNIIGDYYNGEEANPTKEAILQNSGFLNGVSMKGAISIAIAKIEGLGIGNRKVNFRMRDAGFSRQRYWGEPFPIIWSDGIAIPLDADELPLELPHVDKYGPGPNGEGPLANIEDWVNINLTPNPSPKERETRLQGEAELASDHLLENKKDEPGYYNSSLPEWQNTLAFAKENRKELTEAEGVIWQKLRDRQLDGCKFRRQHPIAGYIPDFVCLEKKLIIEIDGEYHNSEEQKSFDEARANWLAENGFEMIRFTNEEVKNNIKDVLIKVSQKLNEVEKTDRSKNEKSNQPSGSGSSLLWRGVGGEVKRETSTMPGYAGSSWYFLRYMDPHNDQTFCDRKASDYWGQVDIYIGGTEHAVGHLLYSRLWTKILFDLGYVSHDEPFKKLVNQGMIQGSSRFVYRLAWSVTGEDFDQSLLPQLFISKSIADKIISEDEEAIKETGGIAKELLIKAFPGREDLSIFRISVIETHVDVSFVNGVELDINHFKNWRNGEYADAQFVFENDGKYICGVETEKMSKSKYNTVNPDVLVQKFGADTFRMYEMFLGPVEQSKPWDTKGIEGVHRFLRKLWRLFYDDLKGKVWNEDKATDAELKVLHRTIKKIDEDTERFSFNTAVSTFMICVNDLADMKCHKKEILEPLLFLLSPYAPHISAELGSLINAKSSPIGEDAERSVYPTFNPALLVESAKEYPVSINGKVRTNINIALDITQADVEQIVLKNEVVQKWLEGKAPKKIIYVKNKMVNVVI
ncbi:MAG: leucine--tRNA ligase [Ferruginibacter sp.]|nr:leucine--tRNA ligase [Ferruginibacter sp.]